MGIFANHGGFIIAAYAVTAVVLIGLVIVIVADGRRLRHRLDELDRLGVRRRSDRRSGGGAPLDATQETRS